MKNNIVFNVRKAVYVPTVATEGVQVVEPKYVAALNQNFNAIGFTLSAEIIEHLQKCTKDDVMKFYKDTYPLALAAVGGHTRAKPIWPNFPADVEEAEKLELYLVNIIFYLTKGQWAPEYDISKELPALVHTSNYIVLHKAKDDEFEDIVTTAILQNMPLSASDKIIVKKVFEEPSLRADIEKIIFDKKIPQKETLALLAAAYLKDGMMPNYLKHQFVNAKDILRVIAVMSDADASLSNKFRIKSLPRKQRAILMELLARQNSLEEDMASNRELWKRVGERLHPGEFEHKYPKVVKAFTKVRANEHIDTFMGTMEVLLAKGKYVELAQHLKARPGLFARQLDVILRKAETNDALGLSVPAILGHFAEVASQVDVRILLSLKNHFANRDNEMNLSTGKSNGASSMAMAREVENISLATCDMVGRIINGAFTEQYSAKEPLGKVYASDVTTALRMPTTLRTAKRALFTAISGSEIALPEDMNIVRGFCYWLTEDESSEYSGTDLDLSASFLDESFNTVLTVGYFNPSDGDLKVFHSGDVRRSGPDGGCEYLDCHLDKLAEKGVRYAAFTLNSYSNEKFSELEECFMGFMSRDGVTGKVFEPRTVVNRFDITSDSVENILFIIDVKRRVAIIADRAIGSGRNSSALGQEASIAKFTKAIVEDKSATVHDMLKCASAAGYLEFCEDPKEADIVISDADLELKENAKRISPYDIAALVTLLA